MTMRVDFSTIKQFEPVDRDPLSNYPWHIMLHQGYHWMDKYGYAHWIEDMDTSYLENALRFAEAACFGIASKWWQFASRLNGEMAIDSADSVAERYASLQVPLVYGIRRQLELRSDGFTSIDEYDLVPDMLTWSLEQAGYQHMGVLEAIHERGMHPTPTPGVYKLGEPWDPEKDG